MGAQSGIAPADRPFASAAALEAALLPLGARWAHQHTSLQHGLCGTLRALSMRSESCGMLGATRWLALLSVAMRRHPTESRLQEHCCATLANVLAHFSSRIGGATSGGSGLGGGGAGDGGGGGGAGGAIGGGSGNGSGGASGSTTTTNADREDRYATSLVSSLRRFSLLELAARALRGCAPSHTELQGEAAALLRRAAKVPALIPAYLACGAPSLLAQLLGCAPPDEASSSASSAAAAGGGGGGGSRGGIGLNRTSRGSSAIGAPSSQLEDDEADASLLPTRHAASAVHALLTPQTNRLLIAQHASWPTAAATAAAIGASSPDAARWSLAPLPVPLPALYAAVGAARAWLAHASDVDACWALPVPLSQSSAAPGVASGSGGSGDGGGSGGDDSLPPEPELVALLRGRGVAGTSRWWTPPEQAGYFDPPTRGGGGSGAGSGGSGVGGGGGGSGGGGGNGGGGGDDDGRVPMGVQAQALALSVVENPVVEAYADYSAAATQSTVAFFGELGYASGRAASKAAAALGAPMRLPPSRASAEEAAAAKKEEEAKVGAALDGLLRQGSSDGVPASSSSLEAQAMPGGDSGGGGGGGVGGGGAVALLPENGATRVRRRPRGGSGGMADDHQPGVQAVTAASVVLLGGSQRGSGSSRGSASTVSTVNAAGTIGDAGYWLGGMADDLLSLVLLAVCADIESACAARAVCVRWRAMLRGSAEGGAGPLHRVRLSDYGAELRSGLLSLPRLARLPRGGLLSLSLCGFATDVGRGGGGGSSPLTDAMLRGALQACPHLTALDLSHSGGGWSPSNLARQLAKRCPALAELSLAGVLSVDDDTLGEMSAGCPALRLLCLNGCAQITDEGIAGVGHDEGAGGPEGVGGSVGGVGVGVASSACAGTLTQLHLFGCEKLTDAAVVALAAHCPRLEVLDVSGTAITDVALQALASSTATPAMASASSATTSSSSPPPLRVLGVGGCNVTDEGIASLAAGCAELRSLYAPNCLALTADAVAALRGGCVRLQCVVLAGCTAVPLAGCAPYRGVMPDGCVV